MTNTVTLREALRSRFNLSSNDVRILLAQNGLEDKKFLARNPTWPNFKEAYDFLGKVNLDELAAWADLVLAEATTTLAARNATMLREANETWLTLTPEERQLQQEDRTEAWREVEACELNGIATKSLPRNWFYENGVVFNQFGRAV